MLDSSSWPAVSTVVSASDCFRPDHQLIYRSIAELAVSGRPCDLVLVSQHLEAAKKLEAAGGLAYLSSIARDTPTAANVMEYAKVVRERALRREWLALSHAIESGISEGGTATELLETVRARMDILAADIATIGSGASVLASVRSAEQITTGVLQPVRYLTEERIPEGLVLIASAPKRKKSWLALQVVKAVAEGGELLGRPTRQGRGLGLFLEDNDRRMAQRLAFLGAQRMTADARARMHMAYTWPKGSEGVTALRDWMRQWPDTIVIVVDVLQKFRSEHDPRASAYAADYAALEGLHALTRDYPGLCILVLHHVRKAKGDSPAETISGTNGLAGAADAYVILEQGPEPNTAKVHIDGRDWELWTHDFVWRFEDGIGWTHTKTLTEEDSLTPAQREWLELARRHGRITPTVAADERSVSKAAASQMLTSLVRRGFLGNDRGTYFPVA